MLSKHAVQLLYWIYLRFVLISYTEDEARSGNGSSQTYRKLVSNALMS